MLVSVCGHQISLNITIWSLYVGSCERSDLCESPSNSATWSTADKVRQRNGKLWPVEAPSAFRHITNKLLETLAQSLLSLTRLQSHLVRNSLRWSRWLYNSLPVCSAFKTDFKSSAQYRLRRNRLGYAWMAVTIYLHLKYLTKQVQGLKLEHSRNVQQIFSPLTVHTTQLSENL